MSEKNVTVKEINVIEALKAILIFLKKFAAYKKRQEAKITLYLYYKTGKGQGAVAIENGKISMIHRAMCKKLLLKMLNEGATVSNELDYKGDKRVAAVDTEYMVTVMAGIEKKAAIAIIASALYFVNVITLKRYNAIKTMLNEPALFDAMEKGYVLCLHICYVSPFRGFF